MRLSSAIFLLLSALFSVIPTKVFAVDNKPFTVVIDPGHGGKDVGCMGLNVNEKTIVLDVARYLGEIIAVEHPEVKTIFTRSDDRFIELNERAAIANRANANLFISIHVNSIDKRTKGRENIHGASVYTLGLHRNDDNLAVAMRENSVIELEDDFSENYLGFDPSSTESYIIFELSQNLHLRQSIEFADAVQQELVATAGRADKGVRQSGFLVLRATSMPAVLVELDFICNPEAERFLASESGRKSCARSIADAFSAYYAKNYVKSSPVNPSDSEISDRIFYAVQIHSSDNPLSQGSSVMEAFTDVRPYSFKGRYNYITGCFNSLKDAKKHLHSVKKQFPDAFVVKMKGNSRIVAD